MGSPRTPLAGEGSGNEDQLYETCVAFPVVNLPLRQSIARPAAITFRALAMSFLYFQSGLGVLLAVLPRYCYLSAIDFEMMADIIIALIIVMVMTVALAPLLSALL